MLHEKKHPTWKNRNLKLILKKKPVRLIERIASLNSSLQIKVYTTLQHGRIKSVFRKNIYMLPLQKFDALNRSY